MVRKQNSDNERLIMLIRNLKKLSNQQDNKIWKALAKDLSRPSRNRRKVNIFKINRYTKDKDIVVIPGKVLGSGILDHNLTVAAFDFSEIAKSKIGKSGKFMFIEDLMKENPKGSKVRILG